MTIKEGRADVTARFVVKRRQTHDGMEFTSVVSPPLSRDAASARIADLNEQYQTPGNYYIEEWKGHR